MIQEEEGMHGETVLLYVDGRFEVALFDFEFDCYRDARTGTRIYDYELILEEEAA